MVSAFTKLCLSLNFFTLWFVSAVRFFPHINAF